MKRNIFSCILPFAFGAASILQADEINFSAGVDYTTDYIANGITQTNGKPTIQAYVEMDEKGFYAGSWISGVDFGNGDDLEVDIYGGYRKQFDNGLFLDVGYAQYLYEKTGSCCGEFKLTGLYPVLDNLGLVGYMAYNPQSGNFNRSAKLAYALNNKIAVTGKYGKSGFNNNEYWQIGASMAFNDVLSGKITYHGAQTGDEGLVFTFSLATDQSNFARLVLNPFGGQ